MPDAPNQSALAWRPDEFGNRGRALYVGRIYVGDVRRLDHPQNQGAPWRAWLMTDSNGSSLGWFVTEDAAKSELMQAAREALASGT